MAYAWSGLETEVAFALAAERSPEAFPFGLYAWADVHHYFGGGSGTLQWFADSEECCAFIEDVLVVDGGDGPTPDAADRAAAVLRTGGLSAANLRALTSLKLQHLAFEWAGSLADLESGDGAFPCRVRDAFRGGQSPDPIAAGERAAFVAFLGDYGI